MARKYPRFIYSNPQNTESKGPFIVHTMDPRIIIKVSRDESEFNNAGNGSAGFEGLYFILLDAEPSENQEEKYFNIMKQANKWLRSQLASGDISY